MVRSTTDLVAIVVAAVAVAVRVVGLMLEVLMANGYQDLEVGVTSLVGLIMRAELQPLASRILGSSQT